MRRFEITDEQYARVEHLLPGKKSDPGRTAADNRLFLSAVLWILRTGAPWRDLPTRFGLWNSTFQRFNRWAAKGRWAALFEALQEPDWEWLMIDGSVILEADGMTAVIPSRKNRLVPREYDEVVYRERNAVERLFNRLKNCRRVATRYEKTARNYLAMRQLAATMLWLA